MDLPAQGQPPPPKLRRLDSGTIVVETTSLPAANWPVATGNSQTFSQSTTQFPNLDFLGSGVPIDFRNIKLNWQNPVYNQQNDPTQPIAATSSGLEVYHPVYASAPHYQLQPCPPFQPFTLPQVNATSMRAPASYHQSLSIHDPFHFSVSALVAGSTDQQYTSQLLGATLSGQNSTPAGSAPHLASYGITADQWLNDINLLPTY